MPATVVWLPWRNHRTGSRPFGRGGFGSWFRVKKGWVGRNSDQQIGLRGKVFSVSANCSSPRYVYVVTVGDVAVETAPLPLPEEASVYRILLQRKLVPAQRCYRYVGYRWNDRQNYASRVLSLAPAGRLGITPAGLFWPTNWVPDKNFEDFQKPCSPQGIRGKVVDRPGIEPNLPAKTAGVLPLHYVSRRVPVPGLQPAPDKP